jgi:hopene-associated glycosyltransferase HpnB
MNALAAILSVISLLGWTYLAVCHGQFWRPKFSDPSPDPDVWPSVDIIVPARDEAEVVPVSLPSLLAQDYPGAWRVLLVDDHSVDNTGALATRIAAKKNKNEHLTVVAAPDLPKGWSGKVAAMQAGLSQSHADYVLFTDADIEHAPGSLKKLVQHSVEQKLDLNSLMVRLHCSRLAEKLLIPAFVFFFAMLYPFRRSDDPDQSVAAAAGGVMLVRRRALDNIGGLNAIKSALIDDCSLAHAIKLGGGDLSTAGKIELSLTNDVKSLRIYNNISEIWQMVARTAFTQLRLSTALLTGTVFGMGLLFLVPALVPTMAAFWPSLFGLTAWIVMTILYLPIVLFYRLQWYWAFSLPAAALIYIAATIDSARLYWRGKGGHWKGRAQA